MSFHATTAAATATTAGTGRAARVRRFSVAGLVATGAAAVALSLAPSPAHADAPQSVNTTAATKVSAESVAQQAHTAAKSAKQGGGGQLDGWINEALDIMKEKGIPGSYEGLHRNIMRESGGDPNAENGWDVNAQAGTPSKGLLQVIQPTFDAYHVKGTPDDLTDPVANITAAANYAADRYGSIDNVDSAY
ncbi:transglycosylase SLT domain-containing protein [Streptomyces sp. HNM0574]|uniref:transglycosylase SLT domain-containing protein n=1 Tax=Streptomyces sp. HNM0574 TaxID=2714954 RepID=UPI00146BF465|nr:transglycosylase SLT domain-containing protein [Streptomyces sp. HNM0574]NLU67147.1 transglycosylase SLT domain-containing protein [Streptomyces sp. HNM0574]